jgi:hypothetical protein
LEAISCSHVVMENLMTRLIAFALLSFAFAAPPASAVVYCKTVGVPQGCVVRPVASPGVGAPGVGVVDPGINHPGAAGNVGVGRAGVGAPGVGVVDPGINQPGAAGNVGVPGAVGGPANRGGPVDRAGRR